MTESSLCVRAMRIQRSVAFSWRWSQRGEQRIASLDLFLEGENTQSRFSTIKPDSSAPRLHSIPHQLQHLQQSSLTRYTLHNSLILFNLYHPPSKCSSLSLPSSPSPLLWPQLRLPVSVCPSSVVDKTTAVVLVPPRAVTPPPPPPRPPTATTGSAPLRTSRSAALAFSPALSRFLEMIARAETPTAATLELLP